MTDAQRSNAQRGLPNPVRTSVAIRWATKESEPVDPLVRYVREALFEQPALAGTEGQVSLVLAGSRAVGYDVPSSDYDLLGVCDAGTYARIREQAGRSLPGAGVDLLPDREEVQRQFGIDVDVVIYEAGPIRDALLAHRDVIRWIWTHAQIIVDHDSTIASIKDAIRLYPRDVLERKIVAHFLRDFDLSVHGITYRAQSQNLFSVVHALSAKIAGYCRMCCLLDGKPFPYDKWLLRASAETRTGKRLAPIFRRILATLTHLGDDLERSWPAVRKAIDALDTEACDLLEEAMVAWGIDRQWIDDSYHLLDNLLFGNLLPSNLLPSRQGEGL